MDTQMSKKRPKQTIPKVKTLFDHIKGITQEPYDPNYWENLSDGDRKTFQPYMIHRFISMNPDWIDIANMFQQYAYELHPSLVYKLYAETLPKSRIFLRYVKGKKTDTFEKDLVQIVSKNFEVSITNALDYLEIFFTYPGGLDELTYILQKYGKTDKEIKKLLKRKK